MEENMLNKEMISTSIQTAWNKIKEKKYEEARQLLEPYIQNIDDISFTPEEKKELFYGLGVIYMHTDLTNQENSKKCKVYFRTAISYGSVEALMDFSGLQPFILSVDDLLFLKKAFEAQTGKQSAFFYAEYARILFNLYKKGEDIDVLRVKKLLQRSLKETEKQSAAYLYLARYWQLNPEKIDPQEAALKAEEYYNLAIKYKSSLAQLELTAFYKKQMPEYSFDLMNASENLDVFVKEITTPIKSKNFSLLLSGPFGCGMETFAQTVMKELDCEFETISLSEMPANLSVMTLYEAAEKKKRGIILKDFDEYLYNRFDFPFPIANSLKLMGILRKNILPVIVCVKDASNLDQELKNTFTFRINFSYMDVPQKEAAYKLFFNFEAPEYLRRLGGLVVDDFARIKKKSKILNVLGDSEKILNLLEEEAKYKAGSSSAYLKPDTLFNYDLVNADLDLLELVEKLKVNSSMNFSILIYGPSGTGKSYFLRYLADQIGVNTIEKTARDLISKYNSETIQNINRMFQEAEARKAMIIMDEIETLLQKRDENLSVYRSEITNAFLIGIENCKYPFAGTTNHYELIDPAIIRRFVFKTKFDYLTKVQNAVAFKHFFKMKAPDALSQIGGLTNGDFSTVKKKAIILDKMNDADELVEMLKDESTQKTTSIISQNIEVADFDKNFLNTDIKQLDALIKQVKNKKKTNISFLLYGPSGTGKSMYLRYIASQLGYEVIERRMSDIVSKWHGETSINLAKAFAEARDRRAFLIFDEIDGILYNKQNITSAWMGEQVNEFLIQLENHPFPVGGTTNYIQNVEPAALRRFTIKALFDYLKPEQYDYVYEKIFGFKLKEDISYFKRLTPALFKKAYTKAFLNEDLGDEKKVFEYFLAEAEQVGNKIKSDTNIQTFNKLKIKAVTQYTKPIADMYPIIQKGFVKVIQEDFSSFGSGFFITKDGFILTNKHVVGKAKSVLVELYSGRQLPAEVLRTHDELDVALLKITDENVCTPLPLKLEEPNPGTTVFSMGNPQGKDQVLAKGNITRYTSNSNGIPRIETDAFGRAGASGGPLMDESGNVIGLNVEMWTDKDSNYKTAMGLILHVPIICALEVLNIEIKGKSK